jgi:shikimate kinase
MGAGKTTVGEACAARLGRRFVDTDAVVEATSGASVRELFDTQGEASFRALERRAIADVSASPDPLVIACGGGAVLDAENRRALRANGCVVWLQAAPEVLGERVGDATDRPLLLGGTPVDTLRRLAVQRDAAYEAAAHVRVDTTGVPVDEVTSLVLARFEAFGPGPTRGPKHA